MAAATKNRPVRLERTSADKSPLGTIESSKVFCDAVIFYRNTDPFSEICPKLFGSPEAKSDERCSPLSDVRTLRPFQFPLLTQNLRAIGATQDLLYPLSRQSIARHLRHAVPCRS